MISDSQITQRKKVKKTQRLFALNDLWMWFLFCSKLWIIFWSWPKQKHTFSKNFLLEKVCLLFFIWNNKLSFEECSKLVPKRFLFMWWQSFRHSYKKLGAHDFNFKSAEHVNNKCFFNTWKFAREVSTFFLQKLN